MIEVNSVTKIYEVKMKAGWLRKRKEQKIAVDNLSMQLRPGEIVGLLGLNGAGKTTTIKMLSTLLAPTSGIITIDGLDSERHRRAIQARVNMIAGGERMLYWRLTGRENLEYFGRLYGLSEAEIAKRIEELLTEVDLLESADIPVEKYSKGMKQRLQIARGLINNPSYLFLDEPTLGLDAPIARQLRKMVKRLATEHGKGILLTSHYLQEVEELCNRVYVINHGQVILSGTPQTVVRNVAGYEVIHLQLSQWSDLMTKNLHHAHQVPFEAIHVQTDEATQQSRLSITTESSDALIPKILRWLAEQDTHIFSLQVEKPTLEDAIIRLSEGGGKDVAILAGIQG
ncbi:ABC transporter ATP-binding protein [Alicyclobacillus sp. SO9]|uniref:ABC transporter ATP-binding protein n=1 Tax=Alicyclobacillus sp. SO9 TaxID=2665646 RepID=UPI0018E776DD|nr:ABC transporter ATP-binding protein [Alicyclobacillus sp. SO9]QQE77108.1 ABC transporter ATP-binding protein [Alicyclobacillus sp. SO9]